MYECHYTAAVFLVAQCQLIYTLLIRLILFELRYAMIAQATDADRAEIRAIADAILAKAERKATAPI